MVLLQTYTFTENDKQAFEKLFKDITIISTDKIYESIEKYGYESAYTRFGNDASDYEYQVIGGRMVYYVLLKSFNSINEYLQKLEQRFVPKVYEHIKRNVSVLEPLIKELDEKLIMKYSWFGICSMVNTYLTRNKYEGEVLETPAILHMRCGFGIYQDDELAAIQYMKDACEMKFCMASPVLFNAGFKKANMASCFLLNAPDDLIPMFDTLRDAAVISKNKGGVGMDVSPIRHSAIGQDGMSKGVIPYLKLVDDTMSWIDQTGKRPGAATTSCQSHHIDLLDFIDCVQKTGDDTMRVKRLNTCIYFSNIFWQRWRDDKDWTLFCPAKTPGLNDATGEEFEKLYVQYENDETITDKKVLKAGDILRRIVNVQRKTGMPYIVHKDAVNYKCNQYNPSSERHNESIKGPNLCLEIFERSNREETGVCNLGQLSLPYYVKGPYVKGEDIRKFIDFDALSQTTQSLIRSLNKVIDYNYYPIETARTSNNRHRPVGLGVSGYSDMLALLDLEYEDESVCFVNKVVFACIYFNSVLESCRLAIKDGPYEYFQGSPMSEGKFQFDMWKDEYKELEKLKHLNKRLRKEEDDNEIDVSVFSIEYEMANNKIITSWDDLRQVVKSCGVRNSLLVALMPSASTSRILENAETIEPHQTNLYTRIFAKDAYVVMNKYAYYDLKKHNVWNEYTSQFLMADNGSLQNFPEFLKKYSDKYSDFDMSKLPDVEKMVRKYKTAFEISQKEVFKQNADRARYICQSQSSNVYMNQPQDYKLEAFHFSTWARGLKTGMYYLRQAPSSDAPKVNVYPEITTFIKELKEEQRTIEAQSSSGVDVCIGCA